MPVLKIFAWLLLIAIAVFTLSPIELRPMSGLPPQAERFTAFFAAALVFSLAYPRRVLWVFAGLAAAALLFELGQLAVSTRHWGLSDLLAKLAGNLAGTAVGWTLARMQRARR